MKNYFLLCLVLPLLITSCKKDTEVRMIDPNLVCKIDDSTVFIPTQRFIAGPEIHLDTKYLPNIILIGSHIRFESQSTMQIKIQKRFQINTLMNSTSNIETKPHGDTIISFKGLNTIYNLSEQEFESIFKIGNIDIVKNAGSYESFDETGVYISYSTDKGTYYSTNLLLQNADAISQEPYFKIEKFEYLDEFKYKELNETVDPTNDKAFYVTAKYSMKFIDREHLDTILIKDANAEFIVYNKNLQ